MSKRRLFERVFPKIEEEITAIIKDLNQKVPTTPVNRVDADLPTLAGRRMEETGREKVTTTSVQNVNVDGNRKRKSQPTTPNSEHQKKRGNQQPVTSDSESEMDTVSTQNTLQKPMSNAKEPFVSLTQRADSFGRPALTKPPQTPITIKFNVSTSNSCASFIATCKRANNNSAPHHSLVTFHQNEPGRKLPATHLAIEISSNDFLPENISRIPEGFNFIFELLLTEDNIPNFLKVVPIFFRWSEGRQATSFVSIPTNWRSALEASLGDSILLKEIPRPF